MTSHRYQTGQFVLIDQLLPGRSSAGRVEIICLMPASTDGELHYRVRGSDKVERAVGESRLSFLGSD